jgi:hypothetical protein
MRLIGLLTLVLTLSLGLVSAAKADRYLVSSRHMWCVGSRDTFVQDRVTIETSFLSGRISISQRDDRITALYGTPCDDRRTICPELCSYVTDTDVCQVIDLDFQGNTLVFFSFQLCWPGCRHQVHCPWQCGHRYSGGELRSVISGRKASRYGNGLRRETVVDNHKFASAPTSHYSHHFPSYSGRSLYTVEPMRYVARPQVYVSQYVAPREVIYVRPPFGGRTYGRSHYGRRH